MYKYGRTTFKTIAGDGKKKSIGLSLKNLQIPWRTSEKKLKNLIVW